MLICLPGTAAWAAPEEPCDVRQSLDRLAAAVERGVELQRAALLLHRVQVSSAMDSRLESDLRDAEKRKQGLEDEQRHLVGEVSAFEERLRTATDRALIDDLTQARRRIESRLEVLRKEVDAAQQRITAASASLDANRRALDDWIRYVDRMLVRP
jgi:predicted  nucleic acid-binding Zn-ribbon protein